MRKDSPCGSLSLTKDNNSFALGADVSVRTPIHYLDGHRVLYTVGCQVALLDHEQHSMHFLPDLRGSKITCLALAYNRKYLAVVENGAVGEGAQVGDISGASVMSGDCAWVCQHWVTSAVRHRLAIVRNPLNHGNCLQPLRSLI